MMTARRRRKLSHRLARLLAIVADPATCERHRKRSARWAAATAERLGVIRRPARCEGCAARRPLTRHHPSHDAALAVAWLCHRCHAEADSAHENARSA